MGPIRKASVIAAPMTPTRVSRTVASRSVPRKACQANIGITAKITGGASVLMNTATVVPRVRTVWTMRSRLLARGVKVSVSRNSGSRTIRAAAWAPKAPSAPSHGVPSPVTHTVRPQPRPATREPIVMAPTSRETSPWSSSAARRPSSPRTSSARTTHTAATELRLKPSATTQS